MRRVKIIIIPVIILIVGLGLVVYFKTTNENKYVLKNTRELNLQNYEDSSELSFIKKDIENKKIVMTSEVHGANENVDLRYKFINYLIDNWDLKYIFLEIGYVEGQLTNNYIQSGNEKYLDCLIEASNVYKSNEAYISLLKRLNEKNKNLPDDKKIQIIGVECIEESDTVANYISCIINENPNLDQDKVTELTNFADEIKKYLLLDSFGINEDNAPEKIVKIVEKLEGHINGNYDSYEASLGEELFDLKFILNNIKNSQSFNKTSSYKTDSDKEFYEARDKYTYNNFKTLKKHFNVDKAYFHYGIKHVYQKPFNDVKFLGAYMNEDEELKNDIYSVNLLYGNGVINHRNEGNIQYSSLGNEMKAVLKNTNFENKDIIIDLNNRRSPFKNSLTPTCFQLTDTSPEVEEKFNGNVGVTTDYFQAVIIINKPTPLKVIKAGE
ncbi:hypothetical protein [Clostridium sp.]|uniref:hypothetical protein n=1 Tax=Clostridium sp. TaxID=1506 RepID=UPI0032177BA5